MSVPAIKHINQMHIECPPIEGRVEHRSLACGEILAIYLSMVNTEEIPDFEGALIITIIESEENDLVISPPCNKDHYNIEATQFGCEEFLKTKKLEKLQVISANTRLLAKTPLFDFENETPGRLYPATEANSSAET